MNFITQEELGQITTLRHQLHSKPQLSKNEQDTASTIIDFLTPLQPYKIFTNVGGYGVVAQFVIDKSLFHSGSENIGNILLRAELDALPISEKNECNYKSKNRGVAHSCGHDGHMAILCGVALWLSRCQQKSLSLAQQEKLSSSKRSIYLIFQPAEEIGEGAKEMVKEFEKLGIDYEYAFALHNWPLIEENEIIIFPECYAWGSTGMIINFKSESSHASEPENSARIDLLISKLLLEIDRLNQKESFSTCIGIEMGERKFGTSPGSGTLLLTVRGKGEKELDLLIEKIEQKAKDVAKENEKCCNKKIETEISYCDIFPPCINHCDANKYIEKALSALNLKSRKNYLGDRGSDDFCYFSNEKKGGFFNIGAGVEKAQIHSSKFDFNDNLIITGVNMFCQIISEF